jgi:hypothetical protein
MRDEYRTDVRREIREVNYVAKHTGWRVAAWIGVAVLFFGALGVGIWYFGVATSDVKGAGDATRKVNSADNRIAAQEHFHTLFNQIKAYDQQLDQAAADKAANPGDDFWATNYAGLVKTCIDAQNQYNADALKVTKAKWLDPELPYEIDATNPATDCKENP